MNRLADLAEPVASGLRKQEGAILGGLLLLVGLFLLPALGPGRLPGSTVTLEHARVVALNQVDPALGLETATVVIVDGPNAGQTLEADIDSTAPGASAQPYVVGDDVVLQVATTPEGTLAAISDRWRAPLLAALLGAFGLVVLLIGGWRGVRALIALVLTIGVIVKIVLPLLLAGWAPVPLAIVAASGVAITTLLLTEGFRRQTLAAILGTLGALALTAVLAALVNSLAAFGLLQSSEDAAYLRSLVGTDFDLGGLLLAAIIFGALGVLDDVTITQAATITELADADHRASRSVLVGRAMNVGRSHIAATINTLVLAYVSASLPLLLLFAVGGQPGTAIASTELVAIEIVRTLVASIGIVAAVPLTTLIAAALVPSAGRASTA